ncbi:MAG TPA: arylsulfatase [Acetobacteraceae bacterium]|nr:arylsulfatase [Acetobacteraceae bacterium]
MAIRDLLLGAAAAACVSLTAPAARAAAPPNILLILADDMGYSDASPYGGEIFTPNIARLAAEGMMLTNFHVAAYCAPTRSMLLTGVDNHVTGLGNMSELLADNQRGKPGYEGYLNGRVATLATILRNAGYHTYMAGKWHLGKTPESIPAAQGFERSAGVLEGGADNYEAKSYTPGYKAVHFFDGRQELTLPPDFYSSKFYADRMIADIDANAADDKPFFGYLAFQAVHQPHQAPAEFTARYISTYAAGWSAISSFRYQRQVELGIMPPGLVLMRPPGTADWNALTPEEKRVDAKRMAVYAGMLEYMDVSIGRVLDHLQSRHMLDNTVVVFMSDNGGEATRLAPMFPDYYRAHFDLSYARMGEKGTYSEYGPGWAAASMTPFANFKGSAAEGGVRAPFVIRYPGHVAEGGRSDAFAYVLDIVPTLLDFAGVQPAAAPAATLGGRSMAALLAGNAARLHPADEPVGYEAAGGAALYRGDNKLVRSAPPYGDGKWRVYDLARDPTETHDLGAAQPALLQSLLADYAAYAKANGVIEVPPGYDVIKQGRANAASRN